MLFKALPGIYAPLRALAARIPSQCAACHAWPAQRVCSACVARFSQPAARCRLCALRVPNGVDACGECLRRTPVLDACLAAVDYAYPWAGALADFKFRGDPGWTHALAGLLRGAPGAGDALDAADRVLPVPLSAERLRERGFNQSALLAACLAGHRADAHTLLRLHHTEAQSGLSRKERLRNLKGAFAVEPARAPSLRGARVVLVDDVMTTGATLEAAAAPLRQAGVAHITGLVLARTQRGQAAPAA
ncbi:ComF family protein [Paracidovorax sp. MALMAid1276]|uniref:ComF family protein n=1 Tax=Paracidovorax sp. MALMAid1276 TaxID=3411631 RepID=UPI003B9B8265